MKIVHRISVNADNSDRESLNRLGVSVESGFVTFEVEESDRRWARLAEWCKEHHAVDDTRTEFSEAELAGSDWLALISDWHHGYPQPREDEFGYLEASYDLKAFCKACGTGLQQKASFQMKTEPKWGRRNLMQLNWVFDEYFLTPELWRIVFAPHQIPYRPVLSLGGAELYSVVQLVVEAETVVETDALMAQPCGTCGTIKYAPVARGRFPRLKSVPPSDVAKTNVYFGSEASANRVVLISQRMRRELLAAGARGVSMIPVAP
jgi:hypothetical protein